MNEFIEILSSVLPLRGRGKERAVQWRGSVMKPAAAGSEGNANASMHPSIHTYMIRMTQERINEMNLMT
jgi:hypothetical protein